MAPLGLGLRPFYSVVSGAGSYTDQMDNLIGRAGSPFVSISELDSNNAVIAAKNYAYTGSSSNRLAVNTVPSDYFPYYKRDYSLWHSDPIDYSSHLLATPMYNYRTSYCHYPWTGNYLYRRSYYPTYNDMSYYLARLIPYYTHPRPIYHNVYSPHYHYEPPAPRTSVVTRVRSYTIPTVYNTYSHYSSTYGY